ncbi:helix-turn-helix transcriptional regulator [Streptomyces sp. SBT349]|uniref:helix-turn-helix transcriptional regulator n=1 Tax=Streptomyces sp. SBT349 TaxID=1580539 RepID=UPI00066DB5A3|nr:helix-turn-helix transcriptional regulator [Streptomyces sp. SBT349]
MTYLRLQRGWSLEELARRVRLSAERQGLRSGITRQRISHFEHGKRTPSEETQLLFAEVFAVPEREVNPLNWPEWLPATDSPLSLGPRSTFAAVREAMTVDRRAFAAYTGAALTALAHQWSLLEPSRLAGSLGGKTVDGALLTWLEDSTAQLAELATAQRQHTVRLLDAHLATLTDLLRDAHYSEETGRRLHIQVARVAQTIGWHRFDQDQQGAAGRFWHAALHSAHAAGDEDLGAGILSDLAYQAVWLRQPGTAVEILAHAISRANHPASRSLLHLRRARAHAQLDDARACHRDIAAAEARLGAAAHRSPPSWCAWLSPADMSVDTGRCFLDLGAGPEAHRHIADGVRQLPQARAKTKAVFLAYEADGFLRSGEVERAAASASQSLTLARSLGADRCLGLLRDLMPAFSRHGRVHEVSELMTAARAASVPLVPR